MNKIKFKYYCLFAALLVLYGCIDSFKPKLDKTDSEYILVVEGLITNEPGSFKIKLSRSVPIDTLISSLEETGAIVTITDDQNNLFELEETVPGTYECLEEDIYAIPGKSYQLHITDSDNNEYESSPVLMQESPELTSLDWRETIETVFIDNEVSEQKGIDIFISTVDPTNTTKYLKWDLSETWEVIIPNSITALDGMGNPYETYVMVPEEKKHCWVTKESQNILIKSIENQQNSNVENFMVKRLGPGEDKLHFRYSIEVRQYSLDKSMYDYWEKLKEFNQDAGTLYDRVPISIFGNITCCNTDNKVLGYFYAADVKKKRIFIEREQHKVITKNSYEECLYVGEPTLYPFAGYYYARSSFCADCRYIGSNEQPDFW